MTHTHLPTKLSQAKKKREGIEYILAHKREEERVLLDESYTFVGD